GRPRRRPADPRRQSGADDDGAGAGGAGRGGGAVGHNSPTSYLADSIFKQPAQFQTRIQRPHGSRRAALPRSSPRGTIRPHPEEAPPGPREARPDDKLRAVSKDDANAGLAQYTRP